MGSRKPASSAPEPHELQDLQELGAGEPPVGGAKPAFGAWPAGVLPGQAHRRKEGAQRPARFTPWEAVKRLRKLHYRPLGLVIFFSTLVFFAIQFVGLSTLDRFQETVIDVKLEALKIQAQMAAGAIAEQAVDRTIEAQLNPSNTRATLRSLKVDGPVRMRIYDGRGTLIQDSNFVDSTNDVIVLDLDPLEKDDSLIERLRPVERFYAFVDGLVFREQRDLYRDIGRDNGFEYEEVANAAFGQLDVGRRENADGELVLSVAAPIRPLQTTVGVLFLTSSGQDIQDVIEEDKRRQLILLIFALASSIGVTLALAYFIARPLSQLTKAAEEATNGTSKALLQIPAFNRPDEIGRLSKALQRMTRTLYDRLESNERFAADVSHEIKNPLSSIRSAIESFENNPNAEARQMLINLIKTDIRRLDKLITDISDASRLDAEMARFGFEPIDLKDLLSVLIEIETMTGGDDRPLLELHCDSAFAGGPVYFHGHESRLVQVFRNLLSNASSFSPAGGRIDVFLRSEKRHGRPHFIISIEDEGPGIPPDNLDRIFDRFYTNRPNTEMASKNSGLGLSISKLIVEGHGGEIDASNKFDPASGEISGARFTVALPAAARG